MIRRSIFHLSRLSSSGSGSIKSPPRDVASSSWLTTEPSLLLLGGSRSFLSPEFILQTEKRVGKPTGNSFIYTEREIFIANGTYLEAYLFWGPCARKRTEPIQLSFVEITHDGFTRLLLFSFLFCSPLKNIIGGNYDQVHVLGSISANQTRTMHKTGCCENGQRCFVTSRDNKCAKKVRK